MQAIEFLSWVVFGLVTSTMLVWLSHRLDRDRLVLGGGLVLLGGWFMVSFAGLSDYSLESLNAFRKEKERP